jgi:hypothetical protein
MEKERSHSCFPAESYLDSPLPEYKINLKK